MKLDKVLCCMFLLTFWALNVRAQNAIVVYSVQGTNRQKCVDYIIRAQCMSTK